MYRHFFKRLLDMVISGCGLIILSPLYLIVAVLVRMKLGSPVIFHQERPGYHEEIFTLCKFRTMTDARGEDGELLSDAERLTSFGSFLRKTSLDELPELWNIFKGDMSIVGPRPLLVGYLPYYTKREQLRHSVRPGLTGLAQVSGRNMVKWDERLSKDVEYVEHLSFLLDLKILWQTAAVVFKSDSVAVETDSVEGFLWDEREPREEENA